LVVDAAIGSGAADIAAGVVANLGPALSAAGLTVATPTATAPTDSSGLIVGLTVQRQADRARTTLRLGRPGAATALWTERFDFAVKDAFAAQDSMAAHTVRAVRAARP
ncbi:MAG TPA: hypothetical protein VG916_00540, partial [Gemmatimonadaceae bacterium]|nr:hypothetical protein [Gemmatimonadaceae bacterium]